MRTGLTVVAVAIMALWIAPGSATARTGSLSGSCHLTGRLTFDRPVGDEPRAVAFDDVASGTCTGTLNGVAVRDAPVRNRATGSGTLSCFGGTATTHDRLSFGHGVRIRLSTIIAGGLSEFAGRFTGRVSGEGIVEVNLLPYLSQPVLAACQAGVLREVRYDLDARTLTPVVG
jgi:hypothetical protein